MNSKAILVGFILFLASTFGTNSIVVPRTQSALMPLFGWAGLYAGLVFSSVIGFIVLIVVFALANKLGIDSEIPEVG